MRAVLKLVQQCTLSGLLAKAALLKLIPGEQRSRLELFPQTYEILKIVSNKTIPNPTKKFMGVFENALLPASLVLAESR